MRIAEIFASIQGEGRWAGTPSTFVRVSGCNLRCAWCDTPYASWSPEGPSMDVGAIAARVAELGVRHVVLTGGEPMLFEGVVPLAERLAEGEHVVTVETAGTVFRELPCALMSISPKLANSTPVESGTAGTNGPAPRGWRERHEAIRSNLEPLRRLVAAYDVQLKFVVDPEGSGDDLTEIEEVLRRLGGIPSDRVMLMAEGTDSETLARRERLLVPVCLERGFRLSPRLHVHWFGNTRGT
ncbi:MAG: 7-carboxy-7-deazaguanine synthase QueE [Chthonomonadaceae bacterium]|nr:7-carboxy-7-deazaguanine synthase QueE [Chthonomonadaceae bacterium]